MKYYFSEELYLKLFRACGSFDQRRDLFYSKFVNLVYDEVDPYAMLYDGIGVEPEGFYGFVSGSEVDINWFLLSL